MSSPSLTLTNDLATPAAPSARRPAAKDALDDDAILVGIPSHVARGNNAFGSRFYVVELVEPPMPSAHSDDARSDVCRRVLCHHL